jgi:hypothetical protein
MSVHDQIAAMDIHIGDPDDVIVVSSICADAVKSSNMAAG